jgi:SNF2 family DNA or RNA helicase
MRLTLEPYQEVARDFLTRDRQPKYACLGVGLGKTAATLSAIHELMLDGCVRTALVVAPLRVAVLTWPNEIAKWDQFKWVKLEVLRGQKPSGQANIYTINYEQLQNLESLDFCDLVVFDEITRAKNPASERIKHIRPLLKNHYRWGLTGTPRPNSLLELFAQVRLLDDGKHLGRAFHAFKETYFSPIDYNAYNWEPKPGSEEKIYAKIKDMTLVMRTSDYLDLPDAVVEDVVLPLPMLARGIYKRLEKELLAQLKGREIVAVNAAVLVNKLLQVTGGAVYTDTREVVVVHEVKINRLKRLLVDLGDEHAIIYTNYIHERDRVCKAIGGTDAATFSGDVEGAWNAGDIKYLVADPRSLGHGLNLQRGGRNVIWFSPTWSRELYDQANGRVFRKGQDQQVRIHRILCEGTMDEVVVETLHNRGEGQSEMMAILTNFQRMGSVFRKP